MPNPAVPTSALPSPHDAMARLLARIEPLGAELVALGDATGRVLGEPITADRPSPPCDVSAMDGYAVRMSDLSAGQLPISGEVVMGHAPPTLPAGCALRIFTGAAVPADADAVIPREQIRELPSAIAFDANLHVVPGQHIRRRGENTPAGATVADPGAVLTPAIIAALAAFGAARINVHRRIRIGVLITGDELLPLNMTPAPLAPWQIYDSNGPTLAALLANVPWIFQLHSQRVADDRPTLEKMLASTLAQCDALLLTGGVSMGDYDFVPDAVRAVGGEIIFHKTALRPGKPMLGAIGPQGQPILGLPGNPVSVAVTSRRWAAAALRKRAGFAQPDPPAPTINVANPDGKRIGLWWYRPVRLTESGHGELVACMGSGDLVCIARSDGFVELPPNAAGPGPWPFYAWSIP